MTTLNICNIKTHHAGIHSVKSTDKHKKHEYSVLLTPVESHNNNSLIKQAADCSFHSRCFTSIYFLLSAALNYRWNKLEAQLRCIVSKFTPPPMFLSTHKSILMRQPGTAFHETIHLYIKNNACINWWWDNNTAERISPSINPFRNWDSDQQKCCYFFVPCNDTKWS